VSRIAATLEKHLKLRLSDQDLYVNVAGGIRIAEVGVDMALAASLYSARTGLPLPANTAMAGELSLAGELRPVRRLSGRIKTSRSLGFETFLAPPEPSQDGGPVYGGNIPVNSDTPAGREAADSEKGTGKIVIAKNLKLAIKSLFS
jgi:predicted ATP-dependent serine protease